MAASSVSKSASVTPTAAASSAAPPPLHTKRPAKAAGKRAAGTSTLRVAVSLVWHSLWALAAMLATWGCSRMFTYISHSLEVLPTELNAWPHSVTQPLDFDLLAPLGGRERLPSPMVVGLETLWNIMLVAQFGLVHVGCARPAVYVLLGSRYHRALFMWATCISYHVIMLGWRHHAGLMVWDLLPVIQTCLSALGVSVSYATLRDIVVPVWSIVPIVLCISTVFQLDVLYFIGVRQLFMTPEAEVAADAEYAREQAERKRYYAKQAAIKEGTYTADAQEDSQDELVKADSKTLKVTGMYRYVRHPMYSWLQCVCVLTPYMTFDRLVYFAATTALLWVGLPFEERKLIREFGQDYVDYTQVTPMLFPSITSLWRGGQQTRTGTKNGTGNLKKVQ